MVDSPTEACEAWQRYFDRRVTFEIPQEDGSLDKFNAYIGGSVHNNVLLCLHGAGHTALSWCLLAKLLKHCFCVVAYDCRGHGLTECRNPHDWSTATLVADGLNIVTKVRELVDAERKVTARTKQTSPRRCVGSDLSAAEISVRERILASSRKDGVPTILMGHSMGGAMAIHMAATQKVPNLQGLLVLDVVEGTALDALPVMDKFIQAFPESFGSTAEAMDWALKHVLSNPASAAVSIPSQLYFDGHVWRWRVNLSATRPYWKEWFLGIGEKFLHAPVGSGGKVLILVGQERLDKALTIAQMQGKFQLTVIPKSGHIVEEDQPEDIMQVVISFAERYRLF